MSLRAGQSPTLMYVPQHRRARPRFATTAAETPPKAVRVFHTMPCHSVMAAVTVKAGLKLVQKKARGLEIIS